MQKVRLKSKGRKRINQACFDMIEEAGKNPIIIIRKQWRLATPPGAHILRKYLKKEYSVRTLEDNSGWRIHRV